MNIAIFGSTSQLAKDLIKSFSSKTDFECTLYSRNTKSVSDWVDNSQFKKKYKIADYSEFRVSDSYDVIINFVGAGDPTKVKALGNSIFDITYKYDAIILDYLEHNPATKYIFLSSGAVYGGDFKKPATKETLAEVDINNFTETDWYASAKLYAEARHRALPNFSIVDVRVFNYFSHTQKLNTRFLIADIVRSLKDNKLFLTSSENIVRDFIIPIDFFRLIQSIINYKSVNMALDCYTKAPVDKIQLLSELANKFGLQYEISEAEESMNATGAKLNYYSLNKLSEDIGYEPLNTSLSGIIDEISIIQNLQ